MQWALNAETNISFAIDASYLTNSTWSSCYLAYLARPSHRIGPSPEYEVQLLGLAPHLPIYVGDLTATVESCDGSIIAQDFVAALHGLSAAAPDPMRMIGQLQNEPSARTFSDYLYVLGIENQVEAEKGGAWAVWVHADDELDRATQLLSDFRNNPTDPKVLKTAQEARVRREQEEQRRTSFQKKFHDRRSLVPALTGYGFGVVTLSLIAISIVFFIISSFGHNVDRVHWLRISDYTVIGSPWDRLEGLPEIRHGQVWRLFTPIFIHFDWMHIFFNLWWLLDLGAMIEARQGRLYLLVLVLAIAGGSNFAQYLVSGPGFGGMSGVVYGLLGFIWIRGKFDPASGLYLHPTTVTMMILWFFICYTGILPVANTVHAVGLGMGMGWGYLSSLHRTYV